MTAAAIRDDAIVITGRGLVCAAGRGVPSLDGALSAGMSFLGPLRAGVADGLTVTEGGQIPDEALGDGAIPPGVDSDRASRACHLASRDALEEAALTKSRARVGLVLGTALGAIEVGERYLGAESPTDDVRKGVRRVLPHTLTQALARAHGLEGRVSTYSATCVSSLYALEQACSDLLRGRSDVVLCGGMDMLTRFMHAGFCALGALPPTEDGRRLHEGFLLGEAACFVALETAAHARRRGASIRGVVTGRGLFCDAVHLTSPDESGRGMVRAVELALGEGGLAPADIGRVSVTASGSPSYAKMYDSVFAALFPAGPPPRDNWETSVGHVLAASGMLGLARASRTESPGASKLESHAEHVLVLTVGFGGQNGATIVSAPGASS